MFVIEIAYLKRRYLFVFNRRKWFMCNVVHIAICNPCIKAIDTFFNRVHQLIQSNDDDGRKSVQFGTSFTNFSNMRLILSHLYF